MQVEASKFQKGVEYFKVKWRNISAQGSTWEPVGHLRGDSAKACLLAFREIRAAKDAEHDARTKALRQGKLDAVSLAEGNNGKSDVLVGETPETERGQKSTFHLRKARSDVWKWFYPKYYDASKRGDYAKCRFCDCAVKCSNTTNLQGHLNSKHADEMKVEKLKGGQVRGSLSFLFKYLCNKVIVVSRFLKLRNFYL